MSASIDRSSIQNNINRFMQTRFKFDVDNSFVSAYLPLVGATHPRADDYTVCC